MVVTLLFVAKTWQLEEGSKKATMMVFERELGDPFSSLEMWLDHLWAR